MPRLQKRRRMSEADGECEAADAATVVRYVAPATIFYRGEICEPHATTFCVKLQKAARKLRGTDRNVDVFLSSEGGDVYAGISMYEHICMVKKRVPVHVIADGYVASAATLVLLAASRRVMRQNATFMIHAVTSFHWGGLKPKELHEEASNTEALMLLLTELYRRHSTLKRRELEKLLDRERNLRYTECLQMGFVDGHE